MNRMKNIWLKSAFLAVAGLSLGSCADFLDVDPLTLVYEDNYWKEKNDVDQVITGCYVRMQGDDFLRRLFIWGESRSDNVRVGMKPDLDVNSAESKIEQEDILATNPYTDWVSFYEIINRCNLVIEKAPQVAEVDPAYLQSDVEAVIAEAKGLRALCYFYLVRAFKDVPFYTHALVDDEQQLNFPATKGDDIVRFLIQDLVEAYPHALKAWPKVNGEDKSYARITQNAIFAMLTDMYLWMGDDVNAAAYAQRVIDSKLAAFKEQYYSSAFMVDGYPLLPDFDSHAFATPGTASMEIFGYGGSVESILELDFDANYKTNGSAANEMTSAFFYRGPNQEYKDHPSEPGLFAPAKELWTEPKDPKLFLNNNDIRVMTSMWFENATEPDQNEVYIAKYAFMRTYLVGFTANLNTAEWMPRNSDDANWILYRVSDVMLMKAEALVWQLPEGEGAWSEHDEALAQEAFDLVQAVSRRSMRNLNSPLAFSDYQSKAKLIELVYDERRRELLFEGKRWFDLVRRSRREGNTEYLRGKIVGKFDGGTGVNATSRMMNIDGVYWPYAESELKYNTNLKQNPAYPDSENNSYESTIK